MAWMTDLHLERVNADGRQEFYGRLRNEVFDSALITGDISESETLALHLSELAEACAPRKIYFVLGNHDFFGSSFAEVDRVVAACCRRHSNLQHLGQGEIVGLSASTALIGHRGWADGRAWGGHRSSVRFAEQDAIQDLRYASTFRAYRKMEQLGKDSAAYFRKRLPLALKCYRHVIVATHFPTFARAVHIGGQPCETVHLPHFVNASAGGVIKKISAYFPESRVTVLCGHSHHAARIRIADNLEVRVGRVRRGNPMFEETLRC